MPWRKWRPLGVQLLVIVPAGLVLAAAPRAIGLAGFAVAVALLRSLKRALAEVACEPARLDRPLARLGNAVQEWHAVGDALHDAAARAAEPPPEARSAA